MEEKKVYRYHCPHCTAHRRSVEVVVSDIPPRDGVRCPVCGSVMVPAAPTPRAFRVTVTEAGGYKYPRCPKCGVADWEYDPTRRRMVCRFCGTPAH